MPPFFVVSAGAGTEKLRSLHSTAPKLPPRPGKRFRQTGHPCPGPARSPACHRRTGKKVVFRPGKAGFLPENTTE